MGKSKAKHIAPGGNANVLDAIDSVTHRRSMHLLAGVEVPQGLSRPRTHGLEFADVIAKEDQAPLAWE